jgi:hypothetical protein
VNVLDEAHSRRFCQIRSSRRTADP